MTEMIIMGSRKRELLTTFLFSSAVYIAFATLYGSYISGLAIFGAFFGSVIRAASFRDLYVIEITDEYIRGPSSGIATRQISREEISREKTCNQSLWYKLSGTYAIRSNKGDQILISKFVFSNSQRDQIIERLKLCRK